MKGYLFLRRGCEYDDVELDGHIHLSKPADFDQFSILGASRYITLNFDVDSVISFTSKIWVSAWIDLWTYDNYGEAIEIGDTRQAVIDLAMKYIDEPCIKEALDQLGLDKNYAILEKESERYNISAPILLIKEVTGNWWLKLVPIFFSLYSMKK